MENQLQLRVLKNLDKSIVTFDPRAKCCFAAVYENQNRKMVELGFVGTLYLTKTVDNTFKLFLLN